MCTVSDNDDVNKLLASIRKRTRDEVDAEDASMQKTTAAATTTNAKGKKNSNNDDDDDDYDAVMTKLRFEARGVSSSNICKPIIIIILFFFKKKNVASFKSFVERC